MKKEVIAFAFIFLILAGAFVFAQTVSDSSVPQDVATYVKDVAQKSGVDQNSINNITQVDQSSLPNDINIQNIDKNNVGIYEVNYSTSNNTQKKVYVITYSTPQLPQEKTSTSVQYLSFGYSGSSSDSNYLTAAGVAVNNDNGYVMMRSGSITGISTSLGSSDGAGKIYIKVYKNGQDTGFENMIASDYSSKKTYTTQSADSVNFEPGDVISVYVQDVNGMKWGDAVTMVEVQN